MRLKEVILISDYFAIQVEARRATYEPSYGFNLTISYVVSDSVISRGKYVVCDFAGSGFRCA